MENKIELFRANGQWHAKHTGPHATEIQALFGTTILPTAFRSTTESAIVKDSLQWLNLNAIVTVRTQKEEYHEIT